MQITKNMKAGFQGKPDAMRIKAEKLLNHPGKADDVYYSKSCADKSQMRAYKEGGSVKKDHCEMDACKKIEERIRTGASKKDKGGRQKFAMGGVAKIRLKQATPQGLPIKVTKKPLTDFL